MLSIRTAADLRAAAVMLRASRAKLADAVLDREELTVPMECPDTANAEIVWTVPGASAGSVPVLEAQLKIRAVRTCTFDVERAGPAGRADLVYEPAAMTWTISDAQGSTITATVDALDASIETTDIEVGRQTLSSIM